MNKKIKHEHLLVRALVKKPPREAGAVSLWASELIGDIGITLLLGPIAGYCEAPGNKGVTCTAILTTSHVAVHVWDEASPALVQLDVYSCAELDRGIVFEKLKRFDPVEIKYKFLDRERDFKKIIAEGDVVL